LQQCYPDGTVFFHGSVPCRAGVQRAY
jgi:hypothetical protein